jgi:hypothetical protein
MQPGNRLNEGGYKQQVEGYGSYFRFRLSCCKTSASVSPSVLLPRDPEMDSLKFFWLSFDEGVFLSIVGEAYEFSTDLFIFGWPEEPKRTWTC